MLQKRDNVSYLLNTISDDFQRVRFHGVPRAIMQKQAGAISIPLYQQKTAASEYEHDYMQALYKLKQHGVDTLVFGDIHLTDCLAWAKKVTKSADMQLSEPLWGSQTERLFTEIIKVGFEAVVVSTQADLLEESWVGRRLDEDFLRDIKRLKGIDICGENGEYHTLVLDGPIFKKRLVIRKAQKVRREGYWFLDIQKCDLVDKE